jgi:hypothetical protein
VDLHPFSSIRLFVPALSQRNTGTTSPLPKAGRPIGWLGDRPPEEVWPDGA